ncbi:outer membrane beta-barrel protein, partial [Acidiphilium sp.]
AGEDTALTLFIDRSIEETTLPGSPAYIYTLVGGRIEHAITDDLTGIARAAFARSDFAQSTRWDNEADMSVGLRYRLMSRVFLGVDYRYTQRISSDSIFNFRRNQVYLELTEEF